MIRRVIISIFCIVLVVSASLIIDADSNDKVIFTSAKANDLPTIIIDAGHGGLTNTIKV